MYKHFLLFVLTFPMVITSFLFFLLIFSSSAFLEIGYAFGPIFLILAMLLQILIVVVIGLDIFSYRPRDIRYIYSKTLSACCVMFLAILSSQFWLFFGTLSIMLGTLGLPPFDFYYYMWTFIGFAGLNVAPLFLRMFLRGAQSHGSKINRLIIFMSEVMLCSGFWQASFSWIASTVTRYSHVYNLTFGLGFGFIAAIWIPGLILLAIWIQVSRGNRDEIVQIIRRLERFDLMVYRKVDSFLTDLILGILRRKTFTVTYFLSCLFGSVTSGIAFSLASANVKSLSYSYYVFLFLVIFGDVFLTIRVCRRFRIGIRGALGTIFLSLMVSLVTVFALFPLSVLGWSAFFTVLITTHFLAGGINILR